MSLIDTLQRAGFQGEALRTAWAIMMRESGGNADAYNGNRSTGDDSHGLFQINMLGSMGANRNAWFKKKIPGYTGPESLKDPLINAKAAYLMSKGGKDWYAWDIDENGYDGGSHAPAFRSWYAKFPGASKGAAGAPGAPAASTAASGDSGTIYTKPDKLKMKDLRLNYGIAASVLKENPELQQVLRDIINGQVTDPATQLALIKETGWYQKHTSQWLDVEKSRLSKDPALWQASIDNNARKIMEQFQAKGAPIDLATARKYADQIAHGSGWVDGEFQIYDEDWLNKTIADAIDFTTTKTINGVSIYDLSGEAGDKAQLLYQMASDYGFDSSMSNQTFTTWFQKSLKGLMDGSLSESQVDDELQTRAMSMFPGLAEQIRAGKTLREASDPYTRALADVWEMDPSAIRLDDGVLTQVINKSDDKGNFSPMSLYEAKLAARRDERFQYTQTAKQEYTSIAQKILQDFGFLG